MKLLLAKEIVESAELRAITFGEIIFPLEMVNLTVRILEREW